MRGYSDGYGRIKSAGRSGDGTTQTAWALDDVFKDFIKLETDYMETVRGAIELCAERKAAKEQNREVR